jgi:hypothetical protein
LTKDNLAKKNWKGGQQCVCCNLNEIIQHLFLDCPSAKMIWRIIFYATNLTQPRSISHMFDTWLNNQLKDYKPLSWVGVAAICWKYRNDIIFKKTKFNSILHVIFRGAYWLRFWQLQHKAQAKDTLIVMSRKLVVVAIQIANRGWNHFFRLS